MSKWMTIEVEESHSVCEGFTMGKVAVGLNVDIEQPCNDLGRRIGVSIEDTNKETSYEFLEQIVDLDQGTVSDHPLVIDSSPSCNA